MVKKNGRKKGGSKKGWNPRKHPRKANGQFKKRK